MCSSDLGYEFAGPDLEVYALEYLQPSTAGAESLTQVGDLKHISSNCKRRLSDFVTRFESAQRHAFSYALERATPWASGLSEALT